MTLGLRADRLCARHAGSDFDALRDVTVRVEPHEILALVGPNGSGKSTLLSALGREIRAREGVVSLDGVDIRSISRRAYARRVARLPQSPETPEGLTVEALVGYGRNPHKGPLASQSSRDREAVARALDQVELSGHRSRPLDQISGGERRRAWLGMVLCQEPDIMLLDEPTVALDLRHQWELLELLVRLNEERGMTVVLSLHDLEQAASVAHRMVVLVRGRVYEVGSIDSALTPEMLLDVFRVDAAVDHTNDFTQVHVRGPGDPLRAF
ncbi:ABC transporter ATP-binding protein [Myxococcota bacterium]|nr:ABC transporter ATP-binding protein [Myxococcota bacterium]